MRLCRPESTTSVYQGSTIVANSTKRVKKRPGYLRKITVSQVKGMPKLPARGAQTAQLYDYVDSNSDMKATFILVSITISLSYLIKALFSQVF